MKILNNSVVNYLYILFYLLLSNFHQHKIHVLITNMKFKKNLSSKLLFEVQQTDNLKFNGMMV